MSWAGVSVKVLRPSHAEVRVRSGDVTTTHNVEITQTFRDAVLSGELAAISDERIVRETFAFLLEREPATSIMREFSLDVVSRFFPEYAEEMKRRLATS